MKIKLNNEEVSKLELFVLDAINTNKMKRVKAKFLNAKQEKHFAIVHISNDEYLFLLDSIELINRVTILFASTGNIDGIKYHLKYYFDKLDLIKYKFNQMTVLHHSLINAQKDKNWIIICNKLKELPIIIDDYLLELLQN